MEDRNTSGKQDAPWAIGAASTGGGPEATRVDQSQYSDLTRLQLESLVRVTPQATGSEPINPQSIPPG